MSKAFSREAFSQLRKTLLDDLSHVAAMAYTAREARGFDCEAVAEIYFNLMIEKIEAAQEAAFKALDALGKTVPDEPTMPMSDVA